MKKLLTLAALVLAGMALTACSDDEKNSLPPVYQGFRYEPSVVHPGDVVTITAVQQKKGRLLNATDYAWSMTVYVEDNGETRAETLSDKRHTNYGGLDSSDPTWEVALPGNTVPGNYTCQFTAQWSNSADGAGGTYSAGTGEGCTGTITTTSYTLYSRGNGSFRLRVQ